MQESFDIRSDAAKHIEDFTCAACAADAAAARDAAAGLTGYEPKVSVVIPVYNSQATLLETLENVLTQTLCEIEVLCVDDGSTDASRRIVGELASVDPRLHLFRQEHQGAAAARNLGLDVARGDYVTFLDADDFYEGNDYLRKLFVAASSSGARAVAGSLVNWHSPQQQERSFSGARFFDGYELTREGIVRWEDWQFDFGFHRFMFDRKLFAGGHHRFTPLAFYEDPVFLVRALQEVGEFYAVPGAVYCYRVSDKPRRWNTGLTLDFIEGVRRNLAFSREHGLAKLHSYTVHHCDYLTEDLRLGENPAVRLGPVRQALLTLVAEVDNNLLRQAGDDEEWLPFHFAMEATLAEESTLSLPRRAFRRARFLVNS